VAVDAARRAASLPAESTSFAGRRTKITELTRLLSRARLVTVTGGARVGKTAAGADHKIIDRALFGSGAKFSETGIDSTPTAERNPLWMIIFTQLAGC
jgi:hypothetical protein